jgi:hypothetical protein
MKCEIKLLQILCIFKCVVILSRISATHYTEIWKEGMVGSLLGMSNEVGVKCEKYSALSCKKPVCCDKFLY